MTRLASVLLFAVSLLSASTAWSRAVFEKALYNEESKSYFELVNITQYNQGYGVPWFKARQLAERRSFGGVQGRLAIIPSAQVDMFIRLNFRPNHQTWFGLYYDCALKNLVWVTGEPYKRNAYANWRDPWYRGQKGLFCKVSYDSKMPVYIAFGDPDHAWAIQLPAKYWSFFLVEYPTGKRLENEKDIKSVSRPFHDLLQPHGQKGE